MGNSCVRGLNGARRAFRIWRGQALERSPAFRILIREVCMVVCVYRAWSSIVEMYCTVARLRAAAVRVLVPLLRACLLHHPLRLEHVETKWLSPKPNKVAQPVAFYGSLSLGGSSQRHRPCLGMPRAFASPARRPIVRLVPSALWPATHSGLAFDTALGPSPAVSRGHLRALRRLLVGGQGGAALA